MKVITTRIWRMREGNIFSLFTLVGGGVTPSQVWKKGVPHPRSGQGGTPSQVQMWGTPIKDRMWYHPSKTGWGTPPIQDWVHPHPRLDRVVPPPVRRLISKAGTCYAAGGVPLAFTKGDFLVCRLTLVISRNRWGYRRLISRLQVPLFLPHFAGHIICQHTDFK